MILRSNDRLWDTYIDKLPREKQDIYYTRQYCKMSELIEGGEAQLFVYEDKDNIALYPYIKHMVDYKERDTLFYDIETAYGYGGPVVKKHDPDFENAFETAFLEYCQTDNIIAEFLRFHPLLENEKIFRREINVLHNRKTVWINLEKSLDEIWMQDISTQNRNTIKKCVKNGLRVEISEDYDEFLEIYNQTMKKVGADDFYFFGKKYYDSVKIAPCYLLMRVRRDRETLAAAIFMEYGDYFHYHLSGSRREFLKLDPNNILLWEAIKYAKTKGCKKMHLGGGLSDIQEDSLFQFKKKFSSECKDFYIGKRVHNRNVYKELIRRWEIDHGEKAKILLQYRQ